MQNFFVSQRAKWLLAIAVIAIGAGFATKSVISYPEECNSDVIASIFLQSVNGIS